MAETERSPCNPANPSLYTTLRYESLGKDKTDRTIFTSFRIPSMAQNFRDVRKEVAAITGKASSGK